MRTALLILGAAALCATGAPAGAKTTCGGPKQPPRSTNIGDGAAKGQASEGVASRPGGQTPPGMAVKKPGNPGGGGSGGGGGGGSPGPSCVPYPGRPCPTTTTAPPPGGQTSGETPH